jgi:hypothetical protein
MLSTKPPDASRPGHAESLTHAEVSAIEKSFELLEQFAASLTYSTQAVPEPELCVRPPL